MVRGGGEVCKGDSCAAAVEIATNAAAIEQKRDRVRIRKGLPRFEVMSRAENRRASPNDNCGP